MQLVLVLTSSPHSGGLVPPAPQQCLRLESQNVRGGLLADFAKVPPE